MDQRLDFMKKWRERFDEVCIHGLKESVMAATNASGNTVGDWGKRRAVQTPKGERVQLSLPDVFENFQAAKTLGVTPAWLAFGVKPKYPLDRDVEEWLGFFIEASPDHRIKLFTAVQSLFPLLGIIPPATEPIPPLTSIRKDGSIKTYDPAKRAGEAPAPYEIVEKKPRRVNRRDEIAVLEEIEAPSKRAKNIVALPQWVNLAAGPGKELEKRKEMRYFREIPNMQGLHSMVVRGQSMSDTLVPDDVIVVRSFNNGDGVRLEPMDGDTKTPMQMIKTYVAHDDICVLSINDEEPTLKRVQYKGSPIDWQMVIVADNPSEWDATPVARKDKVTFWGKVVGRAGRGKDPGVNFGRWR